MTKAYSYLALGDSYTIGEGVLLQKSFPYQLVQQLRRKGFDFAAPEVIARSGWTAEELQRAMEGYSFLAHYDFVSLLVGVNNQYRGKTVEEFQMQLENLLKSAILLANQKDGHVFLLSIPDYSRTPFAQQGDPEKTSREIDLFNKVVKALSIQYKVNFIDICTGYKDVANQPELLAEDGLHPSDIEYAKWSELLLNAILARL